MVTHQILAHKLNNNTREEVIEICWFEMAQFLLEDE